MGDQRGGADILIAVTDDLKGIGEVLGAVFPVTTLQTCIVHPIRNSGDHASWKDRQLLAHGLAPRLHGAASAEAAAQALDEFERDPEGTDVGAVWRWAWDRVIPFATLPC